jgi:hypothetical protein
MHAHEEPIMINKFRLHFSVWLGFVPVNHLDTVYVQHRLRGFCLNSTQWQTLYLFGQKLKLGNTTLSQSSPEILLFRILKINLP